MPAKPLVFNHYPAPQPTDDAVFVFSNEPVIQLDQIEANEGKQFPRHERQLSALLAKQLTLNDNGVFGASLDWACRGYIVQRLSRPKNKTVQGPKLGLTPPQAINDGRRRNEIKDSMVQPRKLRWTDKQKTQAAVDLYLFNVLVALEWHPDDRYLEQLQWAFRRASDFLYDVTDGCMAFGQVVFGGPELMDCADVQIMASNRLHPRAWVSGLHQPQKYTPVRLGRGLWSRRNRVLIPWDEPEAYRTIIHEWAHYALNLRDQYLSEEYVSGDKRLIVPECTVASTSIMATLEGTSELVPHQRGSAERKHEEWTRIHQWFPGLPRHTRPLGGPGRMPLPLPLFHRVGSLKNGASEPAQRTISCNTEPLKTLAQQQPDRCWVFALRDADDRTPQRLVAQGTLDAHAEHYGFDVLGAANGDTLLFVHHPENTPPTIYQGQINSAAELAISADSSSDAPPLVDVVPHLIDGGPDKPDAAYISVRVQSCADELPDAVWLFPFGQDQAPILMGRPDAGNWHSAPQHVPTLDGHILVQWADRRLLTTFSQGGGPPTHVPVTANPVTAGSSDGAIMIFFRDDDWRDPDSLTPDDDHRNTDYSHIKVVTTIMQGVEPDTSDATRGYVYSLASTDQLPANLRPTLVMYHDAQTQGVPRIARLSDDGASWTNFDSYMSPGCGYVAIALDHETAPRLVADDSGEPRIERYRLVWST